jgi:hypothetical protein
MIMTWWRRPLIGAVGLVLLVSCGDDEPAGPTPVAFDVVLSRAAGDLGALLFFVQGGPVDTVESVGYYTASAPYSGVATQVLVADGKLEGTVARVRVPDGHVTYTVVPREAAERGTHRLVTVPDSMVSLVPVFR